MNEAQVKHFIVMERQKGTTIEELIFIKGILQRKANQRRIKEICCSINDKCSSFYSE